MTSIPAFDSPRYRRSVFLSYFCTLLFWGAVYIYMPILAPYAKMVSGSLQSVGLVMGAYGLSQLILRIPLGVLPRCRKSCDLGTVLGRGENVVIVKNDDNGEATFKQLKIYGETTVLHPLNPKYPDIELTRGVHYHIVGKIVEKKKRYCALFQIAGGSSGR